MIRTFVAIDLPRRIQGDLEQIVQILQRSNAPVSWVKPDRIHLTLKFLGDVHENRIVSICDTLQSVAETAEPFELQPAGCGAFPTIKQMRVVWVGLRGDAEALRRLQARVEEGLQPLGFEPEGRPFRAHLTVGRVKGSQRARVLQEALLANQSFSAEAFDVTELVLYKSELRPEGAQYTPLCRAVFPAGLTR
ncbi:MAG: RNA 2',3'-cyclic phosphodiesterase [Syntrophobacteraceae bacterium]